MRRQKANDYFHLHIHKPRVLSRVRLVTEGDRYPKKYKLAIRATDAGEWKQVGEYDRLDVRLTKPERVIAIRWAITEPRDEAYADSEIRQEGITYPAWAVYDIELTEVRLFGKWWHRVITEKA